MRWSLGGEGVGCGVPWGWGDGRGGVGEERSGDRSGGNQFNDKYIISVFSFNFFLKFT